MANLPEACVDTEVAQLDAPAQVMLPTTFREVMAGVCTPVSVVTALAGGTPHGTTVSAFASLSLDPPTVLVALHRGAAPLVMTRQTRHFGLNVLSSSQSGLA